MSGRIRDNPFACGAIGIIGLVTWHKGHDLAVSRAADANALLPAGVVRRARIGVDDIELVVFVDVEPAGSAELLPFGEELPLGIEHLKAGVSAIADEHAPA